MSTTIKSKRRYPLMECVIVSEEEYLWTFADWVPEQLAKVRISYAVDKYPEAIALFVKDTTTGLVWYMIKDKQGSWSDWRQRKLLRIYRTWTDYARKVIKDDAYQASLLKRRCKAR